MVRHGGSGRGARGDQEMVHGVGRAVRNVEPCCLPTRLDRVHCCSRVATKTAWTATTSALVMMMRSASALASAFAAVTLTSAAMMPLCAESAY